MKPLCHWTAVARQSRKKRSARNAVWQHCCLGWNISFSRCSLNDRSVVYLTWDSVPCEGDLLGGTTGKKFWMQLAEHGQGSFPWKLFGWLYLYRHMLYLFFKWYQWFSAVKSMNHIQNKSLCLHNTCVYCVYYMYIYKYTHIHVYIQETTCVYIYILYS